MRPARASFAGAALAMATVGIVYGGLSRTAAADLTPSLPAISGAIYVANEGTATISALHPTVVGNTVKSPTVGTICLGSDTADDFAGTPSASFVGAPCDSQPDHHKPFYDGHVGTHGLWLTSDGILLATNRISGTVVAVDANAAATCTTPCAETVKGYAATGREPHLATARPGTKQAWVAVRGENYVDVLKVDSGAFGEPIATERMKHVGDVLTTLGPSMVSFTHDGNSAFVVAGKDYTVNKFNLSGLAPNELPSAPAASQTLPARFTPFGLVTPDDQQLYTVHKTIPGSSYGQVSILTTDFLDFVRTGLPIGGCANHVAFAGSYAYITIGGAPPCAPGGVDRQGGIVVLDRATNQIVAASQALLSDPTLTLAWATAGMTNIAPYTPGADWSGDPHGIWASPDGTYLFVGHERPCAPCSPSAGAGGNRVSVIYRAKPTDSSKDVVVGTLTDPNPCAGVTAPEPCMKQPIDVVFKPS
jgi:hypothetical protein